MSRADTPDADRARELASTARERGWDNLASVLDSYAETKGDADD